MQSTETTVQVEKILAIITPIFRLVFEDDQLVVTPELNAQEVKNWDSLNHITLVVELEQVTGVTFTSDELARMIKVGDLIDCLVRKGVGK